MHMRHTANCGLSAYIFLHYLMNVTIFVKKKKVVAFKICVLILSTTFVWNISHPKKNWTRYDQKCVLVLIYVRALYNNCFIIPTSAQFLTH